MFSWRLRFRRWRIMHWIKLGMGVISSSLTITAMCWLLNMALTVRDTSYHLRVPPKLRKLPLRDQLEILGYCDNETLMKQKVQDDSARDKFDLVCENLQEERKSFFKPNESVINPFNHTFLVTTPKTCSSDTYMIVLVHSLHGYRAKRDNIRKTWGHAIRTQTWFGNKIHRNIKLLFVLGIHHDEKTENRLQQEIKYHGDIIQGDFYESYKNMTLKSLLGLKWVTEHCPNAKFLLKTDDDVLVNIPALLHIIEHTDMKYSIMGPLNLGSKVLRTGKWGLTKSEYPFAFLPPYESGSAYVISGDVISDIFLASQYFKPLFIDDVYITGIIGRVLHINHRKHDGFAYATSKKPTACDILTNKTISGIFTLPEQLPKLWKDIEMVIETKQNCGISK